MKTKLKKWHIALMSFVALMLAVFTSLFSLKAHPVDDETGEIFIDNYLFLCYNKNYLMSAQSLCFYLFCFLCSFRKHVSCGRAFIIFGRKRNCLLAILNIL